MPSIITAGAASAKSFGFGAKPGATTSFLTYVQSAIGVLASAGTVTCSLGAPSTPGNIQIAFFLAGATSGITTGTGWVSVTTGDGAQNLGIAYRVVPLGDSNSSFNFSSTSYNYNIFAIIEFSKASSPAPTLLADTRTTTGTFSPVTTAGDSTAIIVGTNTYGAGGYGPTPTGATLAKYNGFTYSGWTIEMAIWYINVPGGSLVPAVSVESGAQPGTGFILVG